MPFSFRFAALCCATALYSVQTPASAQTFASRPQTVVTKSEVYRLGSAEMIAPALVDDVSVHPQGRYALIFQKEAALPSVTSSETPITGASALILYDAKLRKTRTLWSRRADGGEHHIYEAKWLPGTDSAVVVAIDTPPRNSDDTARKDAGSTALLLFNFAKSNSPRVLATTSTLFKVDVSPTKPVFVMQDLEGHQARMVNGLTGTLGPVMENEKYGYTVFPAWSADGTTAYGACEIPTQDPAKTSYHDTQWFAWDGKTGEIKLLSEIPPRSAFMKVRPSPLPVVLRTDVLSVPSQKTAPAKAAPPAAVLHPLFLEAADAIQGNGLSVSVLVAPDADKSYLMPDQSAVLYESGGALYAVPLIRLSAGDYAQAQKEAVMQNAKAVGLAISGFTQDNDERFPTQSDFPNRVRRNIKNVAAFDGFVYQSPGPNMASVSEVAKKPVGYLPAPGGRAVLYADGHVIWEPAPLPKP